MKGWQKIYSSMNNFRSEMVKDILKNKGIEVFSLNKKDTAYNNFGEIEIYVRPNQVIKALKIIEDEIQFE